MPLLVVEGLGVSFGGLRAVDQLTFAVEPGEILAVVGPNGAGKTTLFNLISRVCEPDAGRVILDGRVITRIKAHEVVRAGIARTFQSPNLVEHATVVDNLMLGRYRHHRTRLWQQLVYTPAVRRECLEDRRVVETVIDFLDLGSVRESAVTDLPHGLRKVVELGRALATGGRLLLLDEPSSGLGAEERRDMEFWIRDSRDELGTTVMLIEHDLDLVTAVSDRVMVMDAGRMTALGSADEARRSLSATPVRAGG